MVLNYSLVICRVECLCLRIKFLNFIFKKFLFVLYNEQNILP